MEHFHVPLPKAAVNAIASTPLLAAQLMCIYIYSPANDMSRCLS